MLIRGVFDSFGVGSHHEFIVWFEAANDDRIEEEVRTQVLQRVRGFLCDGVRAFEASFLAASQA